MAALNSIRDAVIFASAGALVALLDAVHVYTNTLSYPEETWYFTVTKQPYWVPLLFSGAGVLAGFGHRIVVGRYAPKVTLRSMIIHMIVFLCSYAASGFLKGRPNQLAVVYCILFGRLIIPRIKAISGGVQGKVMNIMYYGALFVLGPLTEAVISSTGRFEYEPGSKHIMHSLVPIWLPPLYLTVAMAVASLDSYLMGHIVVPVTKSNKPKAQ